jgi:hypothetical protein
LANDENEASSCGHDEEKSGVSVSLLGQEKKRRTSWTLEKGPTMNWWWSAP